jgi:hypothetical protein
MNARKAIADISIDRQTGWMLPRFGNRPHHYQAWAHFEKDPTWSKSTWTLLVELAAEPNPSAEEVEATVYFLAPEAPHEVLEAGAGFELFMGQVHHTHGRIKRVLPVGNSA